MNNLGSCLRSLREERKLSLKDVSSKTSLTNSALSRIETDTNAKIIFFQIKELADLYEINIITLLIKSGLISDTDLLHYEMTFKNAYLLSVEESICVQQTINLFTQNRDKQKEV